MKSIRKTAGAKSESRSAISRMIGYTFAPPHGAVFLRLSRANPPKTGQGSCAKCAIFPGIDEKIRLSRAGKPVKIVKMPKILTRIRAFNAKRTAKKINAKMPKKGLTIRFFSCILDEYHKME